MFQLMGNRRYVLLAAVAVFAVVLSACRLGKVTYVVDGDTLDVDGVRIRVLGIDTPERGECGYDQAKALVKQLVGGQGVVVLWNQGRQETDRYGRELGYVHRGDNDLGEVLLRFGLAKARYDSLDGYGWHERQDLYRSIDAATPDPCSGGSVPPPSGVYYPNCDAARAAGAAPIYAGQPGYRAGLDRDGDGVACE